MATYLKNTYVDGSLAVEGELKVQNLSLSETQVATLTSDETVRTPNRLTKFTNYSSQTLQNSVLDSGEYDLSNKLSAKTYPSLSTGSGSNLKKTATQITIKTEKEGDLPAHYDVLLQTKNSDPENKLGSLAYTIGSLALGEEAFINTVNYTSLYDPSTTATIDQLAVLMVPVRPLYLWNRKTDQNNADYKWHAQPQPPFSE